MLAGKIATGAGWMLTARALSNLIGMVSTIVVARILAPEDFGLFAIAFSAMVIISAALELPATIAIIQMDEPTKEDFDSVFTVNLIRGGVLFALLAIAAWPIAIAYSDQRLAWLLLVLAFYPVVLGLRNPYFEIYARDIRFMRAAMLEIGIKLASLIASVVIALVYQSYWALAAGLFASAFMSVFLTFVMASGRPGFSLGSFNKIWSFSFWLGLASMVGQINRQADKLILATAFPKSLLGLYALAAQIVEQLMFALINPINAAFYSGFSRMNGDIPRIRAAFKVAQQAVCVILVPAGFGLAVVADTLIPLLLGERWAGAALFVQFAAPSFSISLLCGPAWGLAMSQGETRKLFFRDIYATTNRLVLQVSGLVIGGIMGFLWMGILASLISVFITFHMVREISGLRILDQVFGTARALIAALIMSIAIIAFKANYPEFMASLNPFLSLFLQIGTGALIYFAAVALMWVLLRRPDGVEMRGLQMAQNTITAIRSRE